jgi:hypothetical protein
MLIKERMAHLAQMEVAFSKLQDSRRVEDVARAAAHPLPPFLLCTYILAHCALLGCHPSRLESMGKHVQN